LAKVEAVARPAALEVYGSLPGELQKDKDRIITLRVKNRVAMMSFAFLASVISVFTIESSKLSTLTLCSLSSLRGLLAVEV
jgi:hypothetical protein